MKLLSEEILKIRKNHKLTQQEFANRIYVTRQVFLNGNVIKHFLAKVWLLKLKKNLMLI